MSSPKKPSPEKFQARIRQIKQEIRSLGYVVKGTVVKTYAVCGKPSCHCARKGDRGHGPYYFWSRLVKGKLVRTALKPERARLLQAAIRENRRLLRLLRKWETISQECIFREST
jgi:hypothetical protein